MKTILTILCILIIAPAYSQVRLSQSPEIQSVANETKFVLLDKQDGSQNINLITWQRLKADIVAEAKGAPGSDGDQGIQGDAGPAGDTGATGSTGPQGDDGAAGADGADGQGVPVGGTTNQVLSKIDSSDYNTQWVAQTVDTNLDLSGVEALGFFTGAHTVDTNDGNGIYDGGGSLSATTNIELGTYRIRIRDASNNIMFQVFGLSNTAALGIANQSQVSALTQGIKLSFAADRDLDIDGDVGVTGKSIHSNGDNLPPTYEYPHQSDVLTTAPTGELGEFYTDDSGAFCWYDGASWIKFAGSGTCT